MDKRLTREDLYKLVWSTPVIKAAKSLGISGVALAKRCRREAIPLPPRGYWAKIAAGQKLPTPELPPKPTQPPVKRSEKKPEVISTEEPEPKPRSVVRRWRSRLSKDDRIETFWCKVDRWRRSYSFGVNWRPWEYNDESWSEHDRLELSATIHSKTKRPYQFIEAWVFPTHVSRDKFDRELTAIGNVWTDRRKKGRLLCAASVPADAFYSLCEAVARNDFQELSVDVRNLSRGHGSTSEISLRPELTDLSDDE